MLCTLLIHSMVAVHYIHLGRVNKFIAHICYMLHRSKVVDERPIKLFHRRLRSLLSAAKEIIRDRPKNLITKFELRDIF